MWSQSEAYYRFIRHIRTGFLSFFLLPPKALNLSPTTMSWKFQNFCQVWTWIERHRQHLFQIGLDIDSIQLAYWSDTSVRWRQKKESRCANTVRRSARILVVVRFSATWTWTFLSRPYKLFISYCHQHHGFSDNFISCSASLLFTRLWAWSQVESRVSGKALNEPVRTRQYRPIKVLQRSSPAFSLYLMILVQVRSSEQS